MLYFDSYGEALQQRPDGWMIQPLDDGFLVLSMEEYTTIYIRGPIFPAPEEGYHAEKSNYQRQRCAY